LTLLYVYGLSPLQIYTINLILLESRLLKAIYNLNKLKDKGFVDKKYLLTFLAKKKVVRKITDKGSKTLIDFIHEIKQIETFINTNGDKTSNFKIIYFPEFGLYCD